jgi:hypothetical protein
MRVIVWVMRKPSPRHQRIRSPLRVGTRTPGPGMDSAAPMRAFRSSLVSATAWPKKAIGVA